MFSLIITIVSIALVAVLALATIYYGGSSLAKSTKTADNAKLLQQGQQLLAALMLYNADNGAYPSGTSSEIESLLISKNYLTSAPSTAWTFNNGSVSVSSATLSLDSCTALNQSLGISGIPSCTDTTYQNKAVCCQ
jgi:type II secretory pathway pseudopilin PulG